jgi:DNA polymerase-1
VLVDDLKRVVRAGLGPYLWLLVHDEIILNVPEHEAEDARRTLVDCMSSKSHEVNVVAEASILGTHWMKA